MTPLPEETPPALGVAAGSADRCPKCGSQLRDPFGLGKLVHDVAECRGFTDKFCDISRCQTAAECGYAGRCLFSPNTGDEARRQKTNSP